MNSYITGEIIKKFLEKELESLMITNEEYLMHINSIDTH